MNKPQLYSGDGKLRLALITAGAVGAYMFAGNVTAASLSPTAEKVDHTEKTSGNRAVDDILYGKKSVGFSGTFENFEASMLATALRGLLVEDVGATVTDQPMPAGLKAGDFVSLDAVNLSAISLKDDADVALVEGTDYRVESAMHGTIEILNTAKFVTAAKASFTSGVSRSFGIMSEGAKRFKLRFEGLNAVTDGKPVLIEFETMLEPASQLQMIADAYQSYDITGDVLFTNGSFGKVTEIG